MSLLPQITLTATMLDFSGNEIGTYTDPAYLRIQLCGYGQTLPCIAGTGMIANCGSSPIDIPYEGAQVTVKLWGNDVITPAGTYYAISILDTNRFVIQSGIYQFTGTQIIDLSQATQIVQPVISPPLAQIQEWKFTVVTPGTTATLPYPPAAGTPVLFFRGGQKLTEGIDYDRSGATITMYSPTIEGDILYALYWTTAL